MTGRRLIMVLAVLCLSAMAASAEWSRTVSAVDTRTPAAGKLQGEVGGIYVDAEGGNGMAASLLARYGIADNWAVSVSPRFLSIDPDHGDSESGLGDTELATIYRITDESSAPVDVAVGAFLSLPTGDDDKGLGSGSVDPALGVGLAKTLGPIIAVGNLGYAFNTDAEDHEEDGVASATLEALLPIEQNASLNAFLNAETASVDGADEEVSVGVGARFLPDENVLLKGAVAIGVTDDAPDLTVGVSLGYEF